MNARSVAITAMTPADPPIHFIDFEGNRTSGILEFGVVTLQGGAIAATRTRRCAATGRVSPMDAAVHGLRAEDVAREPPFTTEWEYFAGLRERGPLAAHFAGTENALLKSVWPYPRSVPDFAQPGRAAHEWGPWIDTGRLYPQFFPQLGDGRLEQLVGECGLKAELDEQAALYCPPDRRRFHAALYDAVGAALLLLALLRQPQYAKSTIPWLLQMSTLDADKRGSMQQRGLF